jgi:hypothetical protein
MLGMLFLMREATLVLAFGLAPLLLLAVLNRRGSAKYWPKSLGLVFAPLVITVVAVLVWNVSRTGKPVITTGAQLVLTLTLVIVHEQGARVFDYSSLFDQVARRHVASGAVPEIADITRVFKETVDINQELFQQYKMTSPEMASAAQKKYLLTWLTRPIEMLDYTNKNLEDAFLLFYSPFVESVLSAASQEVYGNWCRAAFKLGAIYLPLLWLVAAIFRHTRARSYLVASLAIFIWVTVISYAALHIEIRYLLPVMAPVFLILAISVGATICEGGRVLGIRPLLFMPLLRAYWSWRRADPQRGAQRIAELSAVESEIWAVAPVSAVRSRRRRRGEPTHSR